MMELEFRLIIDPGLPRQLPGVVAFGDFDESDDKSAIAYGESKTAVSRFFTDLILGRPLPLIMALRGVEGVGALIAISLFLRRELAIHPGTPALVQAAQLVDQHGIAGLAHIDRDVARFFRLLTAYLPAELRGIELKERLETAIEWVRGYLVDGTLPALPNEPDAPRIIDRGTNGFVLAELSADGTFEEGWIELFRAGFLRGAIFSQSKDDRRRFMVARKSEYLEFNLSRAANILNELETAMSEPVEWRATDLTLSSPPEGTLLLVSAVTDVLLRV